MRERVSGQVLMLCRALARALTIVTLLVGCSPVPRTSGTESPYVRPIQPEDLYVEESDQGLPKIEPGDSIEVVVRRGAGEERSTVTIRDNGRAYVGMLDVALQHLTVPEAEARLTEQLAAIIRNPRVEVSIKQKKLQTHKQKVYLIGGGGELIGGSGGAGTKFMELDRKTTVGQLIARVGYNEFSILDDIRVIRGDARKPEVISVDIERLYRYGDRSQDIVLRDNDIVFVPRQRIGDWNAFLTKINPTLTLLLGTTTLSPEALARFLQQNNIQPVQAPTINVPGR